MKKNTRHVRKAVRTSTIRNRYTCTMDCYHFPHRMGGGKCKFNEDGTYKDGDVEILIPEPEGFPF